VKRLAVEWKEYSLADTAAALAFYGVLALFPFLLFVVAVVGLVLDPHIVRNLVAQLALVAPPQVTAIIGAQLDSLLRGPHTRVLTVGAVLAVWAASGGVSALMQALDRCNDIRETRPFWKTRGIAIACTLVGGVAAVVAVAVAFITPLLARVVGGRLGTLITWARLPVAGVIVLGMWTFLYWALPNVRPRFHLVSVGSVVGVVLWLLASWLFSEYVRHFGRYEATYGALGGVIVLVLWMWISAIAMLLGAEINKLLTPAGKATSPTPQPA
jgi:membrane protein